MIDPHHLLELAQEQANPPGAGAPRQVVLRRAVSTAYYAMFHSLCGSIAETFVTANVGKSRALFYRAIDHGKTRDRCKRLGKNPLEKAENSFFGIATFGPDLRAFANSFVLLQELRHRADYDPEYRVSKSQSQQAVDDAEVAISKLNAADQTEKNLFLSYLLFGLRSF